VKRFWNRYGTVALWTAVAVMAVLAALKLGIEFQRLIRDPGPTGAIDLLLRHHDVQSWFGGVDVYKYVWTAVYPPASHVILWPLLGWLEVPPARWLWAAVTVLALVWFSRIAIRESGTRRRPERLFAALMLLSMNATGVCVGNGQISLLVLPLVTAAVLGLRRGNGGWKDDLLVGLLVLVSLVKPNLSAPFFWLVLFLPGRLRPAILVGMGYAALTLFSAAFQEAGLIQLFKDWIRLSKSDCTPYGSADLHVLLRSIGLEGWMFPASLLVLLIHGVWVWFHRRADIWVCLGVTALVARFWTYHRLYDDVLVVLPMIALLRAARSAPPAGVLLAAAVAAMLLPARLHHIWPQPWPLVFALAHTAVWLAMLVYLLRYAWKENRAG